MTITSRSGFLDGLVELTSLPDGVGGVLLRFFFGDLGFGGAVFILNAGIVLPPLGVAWSLLSSFEHGRVWFAGVCGGASGKVALFPLTVLEGAIFLLEQGVLGTSSTNIDDDVSLLLREEVDIVQFIQRIG